MAIEIKPTRTGMTVLKIQNQNSNNSEKSDFAVTLSETKIPERRAVERSDSVVITNVVTQMRKSFESSSSDTNIDTERAAYLARIKEAIENGSYEINANRIAAKMMNYAF